ncbi:hypothetical protein D3C77_786000 [compost metagenome]
MVTRSWMHLQAPRSKQLSLLQRTEKSFVKEIRMRKRQLKVHAVGITMVLESTVFVFLVYLPSRKLFSAGSAKL